MTHTYDGIEDYTLTVAEVASRARVSTESVNRLLRTGKIPGKRVPHERISNQYRWAVGFAAIDMIADMQADGKVMS